MMSSLLITGVWEGVRGLFLRLHLLAVSLGGPGLFLVALADSSFISVPEGNDLLIVILSIGQSWEVMSYYVMMTTAGSVCGCALLYRVGRAGGQFFQKRLDVDRLQDIQERYRLWGVWAVFVPCMLPPPTPFKVFVLSAGLCRVSFPKFLLAVAFGRSIRYFSWGILAVLYGEAARRFLQENLPIVGTVVFVTLTVLVISFIVLKSRARRKALQQEIV